MGRSQLIFIAIAIRTDLAFPSLDLIESGETTFGGVISLHGAWILRLCHAMGRPSSLFANLKSP